MSIHFLVLNMDKNLDRYTNISNQLNELNCSYTRIKAVNGFDMENDEDVKMILSPRKNLIGTIFKSVDTGKKWIYDGTIFKSFPNLNLLGHHGTKGLTLSNIKAFNTALQMNYEWFCILEDDSELNLEIYTKMKDFIINNNNYDIILMDKRNNGFGGACAIVYNKRIIPQLIYDLHPLSTFSIISSSFENTSNLWDWKLYKYINFINKNYISFPCVPSGNFKSTIDI